MRISGRRAAMKFRKLSFGRNFAALVAIVISTASTAICGAEKPVMAFPVAEVAFPAELAGIDREWNLSFKTVGKVRVVAAADLAYWGRIRDAEAGPQVVLADGGMIRAGAVSVKGDTAAFSLIAGGELKATFAGRDDSDKRLGDLIGYVEPITQRVAWLSEIQPEGYKHVPFVSVERPLGVDACVLEMRLRSGGALFRRGLGMSSASRVEYGIAGYRKFEAEIAIDDAADLAGSVVFRVALETTPNQWQTAYESPVVRGGDGPIPISVDLKNAPRLALIIEFAERGDVCDYAD